jgi:hypothetical protein
VCDWFDVLWFVGFMSLYAIWIKHLTGWPFLIQNAAARPE